MCQIKREMIKIKIRNFFRQIEKQNHESKEINHCDIIRQCSDEFFSSNYNLYIHRHTNIRIIFDTN